MTGSTPTIAVIDDSEAVIALFEHSVADLDVEMVSFSSAAASLEWLKDHQPRLIFLDIIMPEKDGLTFLKELRRTELHAETPVIIISSKDYAQDRNVARDLGALDFVSKPVRVQVLRDLIVEHVGATPRSGQ